MSRTAYALEKTQSYGVPITPSCFDALGVAAKKAGMTRAAFTRKVLCDAVGMVDTVTARKVSQTHPRYAANGKARA